MKKINKIIKLNIITFIFLFATILIAPTVKAETIDHKFSFTAFTCSTLDENNKCKGYNNDYDTEEFDYSKLEVEPGEVIKLGVHYTPGELKTWDMSVFFDYNKDLVTPIYINDNLFIEKATNLNDNYVIDYNDVTDLSKIGSIVQDSSTIEANRVNITEEGDLYYVYFKVKDDAPLGSKFKFIYDLDDDKTHLENGENITSDEIEFQIIDKYTVTYPDGNVIIKNAGDILKLPETWDKDSEVISTVTFKYHNDLDDITSDVTKKFIINMWTIEGTEYNPGDEITINNDIVLEDSYIEEIEGAKFPENPKKTGFEFVGWYTEETGGERVENYSLDEDITLHAQWQVMDNVHIITPDGEEEVPYGTEYTLGTNDTPKEDDTYTVTFKYHDDVTGDLEKSVTVQFTPNGWLVNDVHYDNESSFEVTENVTIEPDYIEAVIPVEFPSEPTRENYEFLGWYTEETDGEKIESYSLEADITLHAQWKITLPTDITIDAEDITIVVGETHQVVVTFTPEGSTDTLTYTGYDNEIISVTDGLVTGLKEGTTTITIGTENTDITKEITVTVLSDKLESDTYSVTDKVRPKENEEDPDITDRIIIGAEDGTYISEFKDNMLNPNEYIKIYDKDGNEVEDSEIVRTGLTIKLEYNGIVLDEASMVVRGDVDGDGFVNVSDYISVLNHALSLETVDDYISFAAGDVEEDNMLNVSDYIKIMDYALRNIDSIND